MNSELYNFFQPQVFNTNDRKSILYFSHYQNVFGICKSGDKVTKNPGLKYYIYNFWKLTNFLFNGTYILLDETTYLQRKILKVTKTTEKIVTKFCDVVSKNIAHNKRKLLAQQKNPFRNRNLPSFYCKQCPNNCRFTTTSEKNLPLHLKTLCRQGILQYIT